MALGCTVTAQGLSLIIIFYCMVGAIFQLNEELKLNIIVRIFHLG